jgi:16S rRNA (cytosine967-C5)-methyltransferase
VSPARRCAFAVLRRVFEHGAYADRALHAEAAELSPRDRALATTLAYGSVQRRGTLDFLIARLCTRPPAKLDPPVLAALRLGLFQLLFLDGVATYAAVNDSVALARGAGSGGSGLVNAVLRRAAREGRSLMAGLNDDDPSSAAVLHSVPQWIVEMWWRELGAEETRALLAQVNTPAESALRVNTLVAGVEEVATALAIKTRRADAVPEGLILEAPFDAHGSRLFAEGAIMPQSRGSMLVARSLAPHSGQRVLDLCAAPGAKTTHLAALMGDEGEVVAVERHPGRAAALERTCRRMHTGSVAVQVGDAAAWRAEQAFDRVLVDPPCSGLGTLQSRPDIRWRARPEAVLELAELQGRILAAGASATAPGGALVYSVCTISRAEAYEVVASFLAARPEFGLEHQAQLLPHRDHTDGFFIARLQRQCRAVGR